VATRRVVSERGDDKLMEEKKKSQVPIVVVLCTQHDCCHLSGSPLTSKHLPPNSRVIVVRSTRGPPCEQLLAAVGVGPGPSVIDVGVVVLVVPVIVVLAIVVITVWS
jgi:hypothetical protein